MPTKRSKPTRIHPDALNLSQAEAATVIGVSPATLRAWLKAGRLVRGRDVLYVGDRPLYPRAVVERIAREGMPTTETAAR